MGNLKKILIEKIVRQLSDKRVPLNEMVLIALDSEYKEMTTVKDELTGEEDTVEKLKQFLPKDDFEDAVLGDYLRLTEIMTDNREKLLSRVYPSKETGEKKQAMIDL
jgi:hypothetical protein